MMTDYLSNLLRRTFNPADSIRPRLLGVFEPPPIRESLAGWNLHAEDVINEQAHGREPSEDFLDLSSVSESDELPLRLTEDRQSESKASLERLADTKKQPSRPRALSPRAREAPSSITEKPPPLVKVEQNPKLSVSNRVRRRAAASAADSEKKGSHQSDRVQAPEVESSIPFRGSPPKKSQQIQPAPQEPLSQRTEAHETVRVSTVSVADRSKTSKVPELQSKKSGNEGPRERLAVVAPRLEEKNEVPIPTTFRQHREKPQVLIGRIKVEVVQEQPKPDPVKVIAVNPRGGNSQSKRSGVSRSKLRFGIGQM